MELEEIPLELKAKKDSLKPEIQKLAEFRMMEFDFKEKVKEKFHQKLFPEIQKLAENRRIERLKAILAPTKI